MPTNSFKNILAQFNFDLESTTSSLLFVGHDYSADEIKFEERRLLNTAHTLKATAVFFRRFEGDQSSKPQLFIFDNTSGRFADAELAEIHRNIWSTGIVPLYYVLDNSSVRIYDARKSVKYDPTTKEIVANPFETISIVAEAHEEFQKYSSKLFLNGTFWEQKVFKDHFQSKGTAENKLIEGLKQVREHFLHESDLKKEHAEQLLVLSILVKYLEERKDEKGNHVFPSNYFN